jgi:hypothetical protein
LTFSDYHSAVVKQNHSTYSHFPISKPKEINFHDHRPTKKFKLMRAAILSRYKLRTRQDYRASDSFQFYSSTFSEDFKKNLHQAINNKSNTRFEVMPTRKVFRSFQWNFHKIKSLNCVNKNLIFQRLCYWKHFSNLAATWTHSKSQKYNYKAQRSWQYVSIEILTETFLV